MGNGTFNLSKVFVVLLWYVGTISAVVRGMNLVRDKLPNVKRFPGNLNISPHQPEIKPLLLSGLSFWLWNKPVHIHLLNYSEKCQKQEKIFFNSGDFLKHGLKSSWGIWKQLWSYCQRELDATRSGFMPHVGKNFIYFVCGHSSTNADKASPWTSKWKTNLSNSVK